jgi:hypothetical protein
MDGYPSDAEEGESLYHVTEDAAYVYTGSSWVEQTVTNHSQLAGISEGDHRSDQRVADLAPVQSRYTDSEARTAVDGSNVSVGHAGTAGDADTLDGNQPEDLTPPSKSARIGYINTSLSYNGRQEVAIDRIAYVDSVDLSTSGTSSSIYVDLNINGGGSLYEGSISAGQNPTFSVDSFGEIQSIAVGHNDDSNPSVSADIIYKTLH